MSARGAVVAVVGVALLAGCQSDPEVIRADPTPSARTSVASPSASVSESAEAESAEEFIRRWIDLGAEMQNTGETAAYLSTTSGCTACDTLADRVADYYANGGYIRAVSPAVKSIDLIATAEPLFKYDVTYVARTTTYRESAGAAEARLAGGRAVYRVTLEMSGSTWLVTQVDARPS